MSEPVSWTLNNIAAYLDENSEGTKYFVQVPKFQRSIVWREDKIRMLVDSIYKDFPIGSLLVYQTSESRDGKVILQLVDGLQRSTSIQKFLKSPLKFAPIQDFIPDKFLAEASKVVFGSDSKGNRDAIYMRIKSWLVSVTELELGQQFNSPALINAISNSDPEISSRLNAWNLQSLGTLDVLLGTILTAVKNFTDYKVPVNIYDGPVENVPTIFERINSQGASLSKYEILAASWTFTEVHVQRMDVISAVHAKYSSMVESGEYEIEGFDSSSPAMGRSYNLYEYLFGLGKVLSNKFPTIFPPSDKADEISPIAFQIFTLAYRLPVAKMGSLSEKLPRNSNGLIDVTALENAIFEATESAEKALMKHLAFKLNSDTAGHSGVKQNQAISYVTSYLANCFDASFSPLPVKASRSKAISDHIPAHFLLDLLRGSWSGHGDSTLFERTWLRPEDAGEDSPENYKASDYYLNPVPADSLRDAFKTWHSEQLDKKQEKRVAYPKDFKPVLKFIYGPIVSHYHAIANNFELEHVMPVAHLKDVISSKNLDGLPMAAIGNLMLLPKEINRIKQAEHLGDYLKSNPDTSDEERSTLQSYLIQPTLEEIVKNDQLDEVTFRQFCESRAEAMIEELLKRIVVG